MIYFYEELVKLAQKLLDEKSMQDDIKAANDLSEIVFALNTAKPTIEFVSAAKYLDKRIKQDYPEICEMHSIASKMGSVLGIDNKKFNRNIMQF